MGGIDGQGYQERIGNGRRHKGGLHSKLLPVMLLCQYSFPFLFI